MKRAIIVGGGKSVREGIHLGLWDKIKGMDVWSLNYSALFMPYLPTKEIFVDRKFYSFNKEWLNELSKEVNVHCRAHDIILKDNFNCESYAVNKEKYLGKEFMQKHRQLFITEMGMSGFFAISLAIFENYSEIFLLGYDFGVKNKGDRDTHWYQSSCDKSNKEMTWLTTGRALFSTGVGNPSVYINNDKNSNDFGKLKKAKDTIAGFNNDIKIYNVNIDSNIECFQKITYTKMFELITGDSF